MSIKNKTFMFSNIYYMKKQFSPWAEIGNNGFFKWTAKAHSQHSQSFPGNPDYNQNSFWKSWVLFH